MYRRGPDNGTRSQPCPRTDSPLHPKRKGEETHRPPQTKEAVQQTRNGHLTCTWTLAGGVMARMIIMMVVGKVVKCEVSSAPWSAIGSGAGVASQAINGPCCATGIHARLRRRGGSGDVRARLHVVRFVSYSGCVHCVSIAAVFIGMWITKVMTMSTISLPIASLLTFWMRRAPAGPRGATGFHARPSRSGLDDVRARLRRGIVRRVRNWATTVNGKERETMMMMLLSPSMCGMPRLRQAAMFAPFAGPRAESEDQFLAVPRAALAGRHTTMP